MTNDLITVLYIEDNPANMRLLKGFFATKKHIKLTAVNNAGDGLEFARQQQPDIILMDIKLPDMSGLEALARLKGHAETAQIPVIAVSAVAQEHNIAAGLNAGFYRYITKPINLAHLEETMYYAVSDTRQAVTASLT